MLMCMLLAALAVSLVHAIPRYMQLTDYAERWYFVNNKNYYMMDAMAYCETTYNSVVVAPHCQSENDAMLELLKLYNGYYLYLGFCEKEYKGRSRKDGFLFLDNDDETVNLNSKGIYSNFYRYALRYIYVPRCVQMRTNGEWYDISYYYYYRYRIKFMCYRPHKFSAVQPAKTYKEAMQHCAGLQQDGKKGVLFSPHSNYDLKEMEKRASGDEVWTGGQREGNSGDYLDADERRLCFYNGRSDAIMNQHKGPGCLYSKDNKIQVDVPCNGTRKFFCEFTGKIELKPTTTTTKRPTLADPTKRPTERPRSTPAPVTTTAETTVAASMASKAKKDNSSTVITIVVVFLVLLVACIVAAVCFVYRAQKTANIKAVESFNPNVQ